MKQLAEVKIAIQHYDDYVHQLKDEIVAAEATVLQMKENIKQFKETDEEELVKLTTGPQEALWDASRKPCVHTKIQNEGWTSVFFPLWTRCAWRSCKKKRTDRKQMMCRHSIDRWFLDLETEQLEEEKQRWHPDNFALCENEEQRGKLQSLAEELVHDIDHIIKQREGDNKYLWEQKVKEWWVESSTESTWL